LALASTSTNDANYLYADPTNHLTPVGTFAASPSAYGAYDMGGDVFQWNEANVSDLNLYRGLRGGSWLHASNFLASSSDSSRIDPTYETYDIGFRVASVASVPEPGTLAMLLAGAVVFGIWRQRRNA
jgi:formylglycine-generating enzyme required for sulfatase activity